MSPTLRDAGTRLISSTQRHTHGASDDGNLAVGIGLLERLRRAALTFPETVR